MSLNCLRVTVRPLILLLYGTGSSPNVNMTTVHSEDIVDDPPTPTSPVIGHQDKLVSFKVCTQISQENLPAEVAAFAGFFKVED